RDLLGQLCDRLAQEMCQQVGAQSSGSAKCFGIAGGCDPEPQLRLYRAWMNAHFDFVTCTRAPHDWLATPETPHELDIATHHLMPVFVRVRRKHEIVCMPAGCEGDCYAALRQFID